MATANDVLTKARSQLGVTEWPPGSNKTKYGKAYGWNGVFWCAIFVWWCFMKAGAEAIIAKSASAADIQDLTVKNKGGKWIMKKNKSVATRKAYIAKAQPGDIVSFDFGAMDAVRDHVGIVESVSGNYLVYIEGNTSEKGSQSNGGMVCRQRRNYTSVCSAVRPAYTKAEEKGYTGSWPKMPKRGCFQKGDKGAEVVKIQKILIWAGFSCGKAGADGDYGNDTAKATESFEKAYGLSVTGKFGPKCLAKAKKIKR